MIGYFVQHLRALGNALRRLFAAPLGTLLSLLVIGIALALPSAAWVVLDNLRSLTGAAAGVQQISVFMATDANEEDAGAIETRLRAAGIANWRFVSREEAQQRLQAAEGMAEVMASLPQNPLPDAFVVELAQQPPAALERLASTFSEWPKVAHVQLDSAWVRRFDAFLRIGKLAIALLAGLLASALVAVTFNTIRLQILAQAAEIEVAKLIGATDAFIRRPFQYYGALQGALGGLLAALLVYASGRLLAAPVNELIALYGGEFVLRGLVGRDVALLAGLGAVLGWVGAQLSVAMHLRRLD
ncbi:MAG: permease-like cell division protein FtsX [Propionivibrio sp.]